MNKEPFQGLGRAELLLSPIIKDRDRDAATTA